MQARYYEPVIGRFYSNDLVVYTGEVDTFNRYFYVANNLFKYTDPNGEEKYYRQVKVTPYGIASEFQRRRKKWILISIVCSCVFLPLLFTLDSFEGQRLSIGITVFTLSLIAWVVFTLTVYTCPKCDTVPFTIVAQGGVVLNPDSCPLCKAILKPENL